MPRRTTLVLDDDVYEMLLRESIRRYGSSRALSRVANELLRRALRDVGDIVRLIYAERYARVTTGEFEEFRKRLSKEFEER
ncbi:MAG: hypothetical protein F7C81_02920 [Desulfurococcales archaeon]|nr:hypothetical protein [Desulfurococcales archaeon]